MTPTRFREIVASPGDDVPLNPKLSAAGPLWTNATVSFALKYEDGEGFQEKAIETSKTVGGKYVVTTTRSHLYKQPIDRILTYDEKASAYKVWAIFEETIAEGNVLYDLEKKIYAHSAHCKGLTELGLGTYSDTVISNRTLIFTNGILFCTRESKDHASC